MSFYDLSSHVTEIFSSFPLFTKGKEKIQFTYAVYLLNKNIAQLRWLYFMHTPELKATLPNLLTFLEGRDCKETLPLVTTSLGLNVEVECQRISEVRDTCNEVPKKYRMYKSNECGPGLSEILAIPEAFMNKQITSESFKNFVASKKTGTSKFFFLHYWQLTRRYTRSSGEICN